MSKNNKFLICCLLIITAGCATVSKAPSGSVPRRIALQTDTYGGWISITNSKHFTLTGELISVNNGNVYVLTGNGIGEMVTEEVISARLIIFNTHTESFAFWTIFGSLSTMSNGFILAFTFPAWIAAGVPITVGESRRINYVDLYEENWDDFRKYARFPQGIPAGIDISTISPRE